MENWTGTLADIFRRSTTHGIKTVFRCLSAKPNYDKIKNHLFKKFSSGLPQKRTLNTKIEALQKKHGGRAKPRKQENRNASESKVAPDRFSAAGRKAHLKEMLGCLDRSAKIAILDGNNLIHDENKVFVEKLNGALKKLRRSGYQIRVIFDANIAFKLREAGYSVVDYYRDIRAIFKLSDIEIFISKSGVQADDYIMRFAERILRNLQEDGHLIVLSNDKFRPYRKRYSSIFQHGILKEVYHFDGQAHFSNTYQAA